MIKTPEQRMKNLLAYFGWQGGTIHQLEAETGVDGDVLLHGKPSATWLASDYSLGSAALETCTKEWRVDVLAGGRRGYADYWLGVADAMSVCREEGAV